MSLPGFNKADLFGDTRIDPDDAATVARLVVWHARTDADERLLLEHLGLDR
jgi:hypothetical protein